MSRARRLLCIVLLQQALVNLIGVVLAEDYEFEPCEAGYPAACSIDGDCITSCGDTSLQRERKDEFCVPESDPDTQICNNAVQNCGKVCTGCVICICFVIAIGLFLIAIMGIYLTNSCGTNRKEEKEEVHKNEDATTAAVAAKSKTNNGGNEKVEEAKTEA